MTFYASHLRSPYAAAKDADSILRTSDQTSNYSYSNSHSQSNSNSTAMYQSYDQEDATQRMSQPHDTGQSATAAWAAGYAADNTCFQQPYSLDLQYDPYLNDSDAERFDGVLDGGVDFDEDGAYDCEWHAASGYNDGPYAHTGLGGAGHHRGLPPVSGTSASDGMYSFGGGRQRYGASLPTAPAAGYSRTRLLPHCDAAATTGLLGGGGGGVANGGGYGYQEPPQPPPHPWGHQARHHNGVAPPLRILPGIQGHSAQLPLHHQPAFKDPRPYAVNANFRLDSANNVTDGELSELAFSSSSTTTTSNRASEWQRPHTAMAPYSDWTLGGGDFGGDFGGYGDSSAVDNMSTYSDTPARARTSLQQRYLQQQQQQQRHQSLIQAMSAASVIASGETRRIAVPHSGRTPAKEAALPRSYPYAFEYDSSGVAAPKYQLGDTTDIEGLADVAKLNNLDGGGKLRRTSLTGAAATPGSFAAAVASDSAAPASNASLTCRGSDVADVAVQPRPVARKLPKRLPTPRYKSTLAASATSTATSTSTSTSTLTPSPYIASTTFTGVTSSTTSASTSASTSTSVSTSTSTSTSVSTSTSASTSVSTSTSTTTATPSYSVYSPYSGSSLSGTTKTINNKQLPKLPEPKTITTPPLPLTSELKLDSARAASRRASICDNSMYDHYDQYAKSCLAAAATTPSHSPATTGGAASTPAFESPPSNSLPHRTSASPESAPLGLASLSPALATYMASSGVTSVTTVTTTTPISAADATRKASLTGLSSLAAYGSDFGKGSYSAGEPDTKSTYLYSFDLSNNNIKYGAAEESAETEPVGLDSLTSASQAAPSSFDISDYLKPYTLPAEYTFDPLPPVPSLPSSLPQPATTAPTSTVSTVYDLYLNPPESAGPKTTVAADVGPMVASLGDAKPSAGVPTPSVPDLTSFHSRPFSATSSDPYSITTASTASATPATKPETSLSSLSSSSSADPPRLYAALEPTTVGATISDYVTATTSSYADSFDYKNLYSTLDRFPLSITTTTSDTKPVATTTATPQDATTLSSTSAVAADSRPSGFQPEMPDGLFTTTTTITTTTTTTTTATTATTSSPIYSFSESTSCYYGKPEASASPSAENIPLFASLSAVSSPSQAATIASPPKYTPSADLPSYISDYLSTDYSQYAAPDFMSYGPLGDVPSEATTIVSTSASLVSVSTADPVTAIPTTSSAIFDDDFYDSYKVDFSTYDFMKQDSAASVAQATEPTSTTTFTTATATTFSSAAISSEAPGSGDSFGYFQSNLATPSSTPAVSSGEQAATTTATKSGEEMGGYYKPTASSQSSASLATTLTSSTKKLSSSVAGKTASTVLGGFSKGIKGGLDGVLSGVSGTVTGHAQADEAAAQQPPAQAPKKGFGFGMAAKFVPNVSGLLGSAAAAAKPAPQQQQQQQQPRQDPMDTQAPDAYSMANGHGTADPSVPRDVDFYDTTTTTFNSLTTMTMTPSEAMYYESLQPYESKEYEPEPEPMPMPMPTMPVAAPPPDTSQTKGGAPKKSGGGGAGLLSSLSGKAATLAPQTTGSSASGSGGVFGSFLGKAAAAVQSATQVVNQGASKAATAVTQKVQADPPTTTLNAIPGETRPAHGYLDDGVDYKNSNLPYAALDSAAGDPQQYTATNHYYSNGNQGHQALPAAPQPSGKMLPTVPPARSTGKKLPTINGKSMGYLMKQQPTEIYEDDLASLDEAESEKGGLVGLTVASSYCVDSEQDDYYMDPQRTTPSSTSATGRLAATATAKGTASCYYEQSHDVGGGGYDYREDYFDEEDEYKYLEREEIEEYEQHARGQNQQEHLEGVARSKPKLLSTSSRREQSSALDYLDEIHDDDDDDDNYIEENYPSEDSGNYLDESSSGSIAVLGAPEGSAKLNGRAASPPLGDGLAPKAAVEAATAGNLHQHIKKQKSIILEEEEDEDDDFRGELNGVGRRGGSFKATRTPISRRSSRDTIDEDGAEDDDDDMPDMLATHKILENKKKKMLTRGETEEVVSGHMHIMRKADVTAKQRWHWAYNKIIIQLNVSTITTK